MVRLSARNDVRTLPSPPAIGHQPLNAAFAATVNITLPGTFLDICILMTPFVSNNPLHGAMLGALRNKFGADAGFDAIEMTRAAEQSGRFQMSVMNRITAR